MTGTLHGLLIYRLQDELKKRGHEISYDNLSDSLVNVLVKIDDDVLTGEFVALPSGRGFIKS